MVWPVDDDFLVEIGRSAHLFHSLHELICMTISNICARRSRYQEMQVCLSAFTSFDTSLSMLEALYKSLFEDDEATKQLVEITKDIRRVKARRNSVTHSSWLPGGGGDWVQWKSRKNRGVGLEMGGDVYSVEQLQRLNRDIEKVHLALTKFVFDDHERGNRVFNVHDLGIVGTPRND